MNGGDRACNTIVVVGVYCSIVVVPNSTAEREVIGMLYWML